MAQQADSTEQIISSGALTTEWKQQLVIQFSSYMTILELKGHPAFQELKNYKDSLHSTLDTASIVLKNGGIWNPVKMPNTKKVIKKMLFKKKQDSAYHNTIKYMAFSTQFRKTGYPYHMIDSLSFTRSYFDSSDELLLKVQFVNKPYIEEDRLKLTERRILFQKEKK
ncbi:hypothetical protein SAMN04488029_3267 [Reichenbachiella faecimaris]|uniref:Uncharacterized protein n=1 Tax=Reichenbachiella faecimaris TaxID=692418 RepID=A0A1W2GKG8_REIFA|nr:hypothetical protein [Reichenbachiella faecimaris]SMD37155.1 hypothetical protein SAMN04488029_3267 [Reichenbachiella faecimaris]